MNARGQSLVEFALVLPVLLFIILGALEAGLLIATQTEQQRRTALVAQWAAARPGDSSWSSIAARELPGCDVTVEESHPGLVTAGATCAYTPRLTNGLGWSGLPISTEADAVTGDPEPSPSPEPTPSEALP